MLTLPASARDKQCIHTLYAVLARPWYSIYKRDLRAVRQVTRPAAKTCHTAGLRGHPNLCTGGVLGNWGLPTMSAIIAVQCGQESLQFYTIIVLQLEVPA